MRHERQLNYYINDFNEKLVTFQLMCNNKYRIQFKEFTDKIATGQQW